MLPTLVKTNRGFTLVEMLVAIGILSLSIGATFAAVQNGIQTSTIAKDQITAFYLVQEGMEFIRNIRDENALKAVDGSSVNWLAGLASQSSDPCWFTNNCMIDSPAKTITMCAVGSINACANLRQDTASGLFGYNGLWPVTSFKRAIKFTSVSTNEVKVTITILWTTRGVNKTFVVSESLFNHASDSTPPPLGSFTVDTNGTLTNSLKAYWKMDEFGGSRIDAIGDNNLSDNNGVTYAGGISGNSASFEKDNRQYLTALDSVDLSTGDIDFTISLWFYADENGDCDWPDPINPTLMMKGVNGAIYEYLVLVNDSASGCSGIDNGLGLAINNGGASPQRSGSIPINTWHHLIMWHNASSNTVNVVYDGGSVVSSSYSSGTYDSSASLFFGGDGDPNPANRYWDGRIDEVGFWKRVLTATERADLYNSGLGNTYNP